MMDERSQEDPVPDGDGSGGPEPESDPTVRGFAADIHAEPGWPGSRDVAEGPDPADGEPGVGGARLRVDLDLRVAWSVSATPRGAWRWPVAPGRAVVTSPLVVAACWNCDETGGVAGWIIAVSGAVLVAVVRWVRAR